MEFVRFLGTAPGESEAENSRWARHFREIAQHPKGSDPLFHPEPGRESDEAAAEEVERYRHENGLPSFNDSDFCSSSFSVPQPPAAGLQRHGGA